LERGGGGKTKRIWQSRGYGFRGKINKKVKKDTHRRASEHKIEIVWVYPFQKGPKKYTGIDQEVDMGGRSNFTLVTKGGAACWGRREGERGRLSKEGEQERELLDRLEVVCLLLKDRGLQIGFQ